MSITIEQIARKLGVSRSTVSRALKDHPRISGETRRLVHETAQALGYIPNYLAQSLNSSRTRSLGMVITEMSDPFNWQVVDGVEQTAYENDYSILVSMAHGDRSKEIAVIEEFQRRRVEGIIVSSSHLASRYSEELRHIQLPVVLINSQLEGENLSRVAIDDRTGAKDAANYLISLGHERIAYIGSPNRPMSSEKRHQGYREAMETAGLPPLHLRPTDRGFPPGNLVDYELGKSITSEIIRLQFTAAFCYNDMIALGVMAGLREGGLLIPGDVSIVGFDDIELAQIAIPPLTTMRQPRLKLGQNAASLLINILNDKPAGSEILPAELVIRESTTGL